MSLIVVVTPESLMTRKAYIVDQMKRITLATARVRSVARYIDQWFSEVPFGSAERHGGWDYLVQGEYADV
jgi:hypothetical protein